jgi:hypothetical protein
MKRCVSGAKPDVQNRMIKKNQVLRARIISNLSMFSIGFGAGTIGAGAASCYIKIY